MADQVRRQNNGSLNEETDPGRAQMGGQEVQGDQVLPDAGADGARKFLGVLPIIGKCPSNECPICERGGAHAVRVPRRRRTIETV